MKKLTIEEMQQIAKKRGGKCLSKKYVNHNTKLEWKCEKGHTWNAIPSSVKKGTWCKLCSHLKSGDSQRLSIKEMQQIAKDRGGKCLSKKYVNFNTKLKWECIEGHNWLSAPSSIKRGSWCPKCKSYFNEEICRLTFEELFRTPFNKTKPSWLINSRSNRMELDGYSNKLKIAFEYNGAQHYKINRFSKTKTELKQRIKDDIDKKSICKKKKILLIVITYEDNLLDLPIKIKNILLKNNINIKKINFKKNIDFNKIYQHRAFINEMQEIAKGRGGKCLASKYDKSSTHYKWKCKKGHIWENSFNNIKNKGQWCRVCATKKNSEAQRLTIKAMQILAKKMEGECLSKKYTNVHSKIKWRCSKGHIWKSLPLSVKKGHWCNICAQEIRVSKQRLTIEEMQQIAKKRGGKCLSKKYVNNSTKLEWKCSDGHRWFATPDKVKGSKSKKGTWCRKCYNNKK